MLEFCFIPGTMNGRLGSAYDPSGRRKYLTRAEGVRYLKQAALLPKAESLFCLTLYYTGCRISEALNLRRGDIDFEANVILIRSLKKRGKILIRRVPIPETIVREILTIQPEFESPLWKFSRTTGWRVVKRVMAICDIQGMHATSKGLRHGFGVRSAIAQIPVTQIQTWMGHSDLATTAIYLAVKDDEERKLIERTW